MLEGRLIVDALGPGALNMAVDEALLADAAESGTATLRFYGWNEPTLSLGYFQQYEDRKFHPASRDCAVVRRQTGGGAILHDRELTYSLTLPISHALAIQNARLYAVVHHAFIEAVSSMISATVPGNLARREESDTQATEGEPFLCFQRRAIGDVVFATTRDRRSGQRAEKMPRTSDWKILGSAQRRYRGAILQHGSLLLQQSPSAPELAGLFDLVGQNFETAEVTKLVATRLENALRMHLHRSVLPPKLQSKAEKLANIKYGSAGWTKRR
ncbi:MAG TPA: hypothetical protein VHE81_01240 [Lacipirellulaceae bacterium]|nr:hypothetical protein [Lacipirellulaceae bacterium]